MQQALLNRVEAIRDSASLVWLVDHVVGDDHYATSLKAAALHAAVQAGPAIVPPIAQALSRSKKPEDVMAVLMAVEELGKVAQSMADAIVPLVDHPEATVREAAAMALAKLAAPQGIEPLVRRIGKESDRTPLRFAAALEILTRQKLGLSPDAWSNWFAAEGLRYTSGQVELGGGEPAVVQQAAGYFHGIPQDSRSIVYVIDVSGSMVVSMTNPVFEGQPPQRRPIPAPAGEESRMECSRKELVKALGSLPPGTKFDIIAFGTTAERYSPKMIEASPASIKKAQKFVEDLEPNGATNIYDAMESALGLAGRGSIDKYYGSSVDTIFLLTDGQPTIGPMDDSTERILDAVHRMNPYKRVIVHTIGLGNGIDSRFLDQLAHDNSGVFVKR